MEPEVQYVACAMARQALSCQEPPPKTGGSGENLAAAHVPDATRPLSPDRRAGQDTLRRSALSHPGGKRFDSGLADVRIFHICHGRRRPSLAEAGLNMVP